MVNMLIGFVIGCIVIIACYFFLVIAYEVMDVMAEEDIKLFSGMREKVKKIVRKCLRKKEND